MKRALLAGAVVAVLAALYGLSGPASPPPVPLQTASPEGHCAPEGALGAWGDRTYRCIGGYWTPLR